MTKFMTLGMEKQHILWYLRIESDLVLSKQLDVGSGRAICRIY
jgi:hypothetical protein